VEFQLHDIHLIDWDNLDHQRLDYKEWLYVHEDDIMIELAESGADRELDFDLESEIEKRYVQYCKDFD
tara:strand:- start:359 stop:562 length:204 start_codon:yes stop_codon:yes gene_type:complete